MTTRTIFITLIAIITIISKSHAQNEIIETIDEARQLYQQKNLSQSVSYLSRALELMNEELLRQLESIFPEPLKNWRADTPLSHVTKSAYTLSLVSRCKYFKKGGGQSVDIEIETNTPRIANIKMAFMNPLVVKQMGVGAKVSSVDDRSCIERYDPIDKFAELIFVPTSTLLITIRGHDMKNVDVVAEFAQKIKWELLDEIFP
jgi:hypothetical protein